MTYTITESRTFTRTSARYLASKVAADLHRMRAYYGKPTIEQIAAYEAELVELLVEDCLESVEYGFKREGKRVVSLRYEVGPDGSLSDDRAGGVYARADVFGATPYSYLMFGRKWNSLSAAERDGIEARLPFRRTTTSGPSDGSGYWLVDRTYAVDGMGARRRMFRPY